MTRESHEISLLWQRAQVEAATAELEWLEKADRRIVNTGCLIAIEYSGPRGSARLKAFALDPAFSSFLETHGYLFDRTLVLDYPRRHSGLQSLHLFVLERVKNFLEDEKLGLFEVVAN